MTWKSVALIVTGMTGIFVTYERMSKNDLVDSIETRVSREEFQRHVEQVERWQDKADRRHERIETRIEALSHVGVSPPINWHAQWVNVSVPPTAEELRNERIRSLNEMAVKFNGE